MSATGSLLTRSPDTRCLVEDGARRRRGGSGLPVVGVLGYLVGDQEIARRGLAPGGSHAVFALDYFDHLAAHGMQPVAVPPLSPQLTAAYLAELDGLVLTGGPDVNPDFYGEKPHPRLKPALRERDEFEIAIVRAASAERLPVLAICRGTQVVNVALGGTLRQDVDSDNDLLRHGTGTFTPTFHDIDVVDERLRALLGDRLTVNSLHHQAIAAVGTGLRVAAVASDGLIESVLSDDGLILGVQWHPEQLALGTVAGDAPFAWLRSRLLEISRALPYRPK